MLETFIRFQLEQLATRNAHHTFERLAVRIARARIAPNILLANGPVAAGGDQGRDAESFGTGVDESLAAGGSNGSVVVACTTQSRDLPSKVVADVASICRAGVRPVGKVAFFSVNSIPVSAVHRLQRRAMDEFNVELDIISGDQIAVMLADQDLIDHAARELNIPAHMYRDANAVTDADTPPIRRTAVYGPTEWLAPPHANGPELVLRCAIAIPEATFAASSAPGEVPIRFSKTDLENVFEDALQQSLVRDRFSQLFFKWKWREVGDWSIQGGSPGPSVVSATVKIDWGAWRIRQPLGLFSHLMVGESPHGASAVLAFDLWLNILELDADRRPSDVAYRTTLPPAPAALSLRELVQAVDFLVRSTSEIAASLIDVISPTYDTGAEIDVWVLHDGLEIERLVDLRGVKLLTPAARSTRGHIREVLSGSLKSGPEWPAPDFSRKLVASILEANDFRNFGHLL